MYLKKTTFYISNFQVGLGVFIYHYGSYVTNEYAKCYSGLFGHMFLFLWNFILWAPYINKIFLFMIACFKRKRGKKNVVSNVIPFARSRWCLCVGLQVNFKL